MKKIILTIFTLMISYTTNASWASVFSPTNMIGCGAGAAGIYAINIGSEKDLSELSQGMVAGCLITGAITHFFDKSLAQKYAAKEREDRRKLMNVIQEYRYQDASTLDVNGDISNRYNLKKVIVPSKSHPDGSISLEHLRIQLDKAGSDLLLGE